MESFLGEDYQIITAENGKVAWDILTVNDERQTVDGSATSSRHQSSAVNRQPDLIISDLMMPIMDGFQLLEKIKSKDNLRHLPVIMLTARADVKVKLKALRIGVDDYLTKPFIEEGNKSPNP